MSLSQWIDLEPADGDPRRCPKHGEMISSPDGLFDGLCGRCEREAEMAYEAECEQAECEARELDLPLARQQRDAALQRERELRARAADAKREIEALRAALFAITECQDARVARELATQALCPF